MEPGWDDDSVTADQDGSEPSPDVGTPNGGEPSSRVRREFLLAGPPKTFALYDLADYVGPGIGGPSTLTRALARRLDPDDAVVWGLEFGNATVTVLRDPGTGEWRFGVQGSARAARDFYARWGVVHLAYA